MAQTELTNDALEIAARRLCEMRGVDPEEIQVSPSNSAHAVVRKTKAWCIAKAEIKTHLQLTAAINFALEQTK